MLPELFLDRMKETLGEEYGEFVESLNRERYQAFRLNPLKRNKNGFSAAEAGREIRANDFDSANETSGEENRKMIPVSFREFLKGTEPVPWEKDGFYYSSKKQPGKHPYHEAGVYYIQEPSAMAPVPLLDVKPGEKVLDLCAAPGGKSTQIAGYLQGEGLLVCNEIHPQRAKILSENIERMGVVNACVTNEAPERLSGFFPEYFDRILVDAPCSGEGMFRKNEEAGLEWSAENVKMCAARQDAILDEAAKMLKPAGQIVYSTCTFAEEEDEGSIERFLIRHKEFSLMEMRKLLPHKVKGEGHFAAVLRREGMEDSGYESVPQGGLQRGLTAQEIRSELKDFEEFVKLNLTEKPVSQAAKNLASFGDKDPLDQKPGKLICFGSNLYWIPDMMPAVKGLKVLRTGLWVGMLKKNRFEPSHALALALDPGDFQRLIDLPSDGDEIMRYLNGQTLSLDGEKGWNLICVDGFGTGWGKLAGGVLKNHYPKGLRL